MKLNISERIAAPRSVVREVLRSAGFVDACVDATSTIRSAQCEDGDPYRVRWVAPTRLPRVLKRFEGRAPESVNWLETLSWDDDGNRATLVVAPDVPESWRDRYRSRGVITLADDDDHTQVSYELEFSMEFGLVGKALEKLLSSEIESLLKSRLDVLATLAAQR